jgi:DNA-binding Xre family transcriptional regulator
MCRDGAGLVFIVITNVKFIMKQKKISHETFKNDTGIHIGRILSQNHNITLSTLEKIASYLDVHVNDLTN